MKRYKWKIEEDQKLIDAMENQPEHPDWDDICKRLNSFGIIKDKKQIKIRWKNHLSPSLLRENWSYDESCRLLEFFVKKANKWSELSSFFPGRSDNCIKNRIFSLIRKALRMAFKLAGKNKKNVPSREISKIKPSIMSSFVCSSFKDRSKGKESDIRVIDFIKDLAFNSYKEIKEKFSIEGVSHVRFMIDKLFQMNKEENSKKEKKKIKKAVKRIRVSKQKKQAVTNKEDLNVSEVKLVIETIIQTGQQIEHYLPLLQNLSKDNKKDVRGLLGKIENLINEVKIKLHDRNKKKSLCLNDLQEFFNLNDNKNQIEDNENLNDQKKPNKRASGIYGKSNFGNIVRSRKIFNEPLSISVKESLAEPSESLEVNYDNLSLLERLNMNFIKPLGIMASQGDRRKSKPEQPLEENPNLFNKVQQRRKGSDIIYNRVRSQNDLTYWNEYF